MGILKKLINLPQAWSEFLQVAVVSERLCLPFYYPTIEQFEAFQLGYRVDANTLAPLFGNNEGDWLSDAYVICRNYFSDPFVVRLSEHALAYPVYYAQHGAGQWTFEKIADCLDAFQDELIYFQQLEQNPAQWIHYLETEKDLSHELWQELYHGLNNSLSDDRTHHETILDSELWVHGKLILTAIGNNKIKVVSFLKQHFNITGSEALALVNQLPIELGCYVEKFSLKLQRDLKKIGAEVEFRADDCEI